MSVNLNMEDIKKMASMLAENQINIKDPNLTGPKRVKIMEPNEDNAQIINMGNCQEVVNSSASEKSQTSPIVPTVNDVYFIMGYNVPIHTFYLIIILLILGVAIWYLNSNYRKKSKKVLVEHDENNE